MGIDAPTGTTGGTAGSSGTTAVGDDTGTSTGPPSGDTTTDTGSNGEASSSGGDEPTPEEYESCFDIGMMVPCVAEVLCLWDVEDGCEPLIDDEALCSLWPTEQLCDASTAGCSWDGENDPPCTEN